MLEKLNSGNAAGNTSISGMKGKTVGEFSDGEWEKLLSKVDQELELYRQELKKQERIAEKQKPEADVSESRMKSSEELKREQDMMKNGSLNSIRFRNMDSCISDARTYAVKKGEITYQRSDDISEQALLRLVGNGGWAPYSRLADENGRIEYNGVTYYCDFKKNALCLGDMTDVNNIMTINLSGEGYLKVNRDSLDELMSSIELFSPQDITLIMRAIAKDNKLKQMQKELEDEASGIDIVDGKEVEKEKEEYFA